MFRAFNGNKIIIPISEAIRSGIYYCPACNEKVYVKGHYLDPQPGHQRMHFAHYQNEQTICPISLAEREYESNDKSEWHKEWQNKFPINHQEYWMNDFKKWYRADVYLEEQKRVIEFQHSRLSVEEFNKRNEFYQKKGLTIIWLFDFDNYKNDERIEKMNSSWLEKNKPNWARVLKNKRQIPYTLSFYERKFGRFKPQINPNVQLFFSFSDENATQFRKMVYINDDFSILTTQIVDGVEEFIKICGAESLFTPIDEIEKAIEADEKREKELKEAAERQRRNKEIIERFINEVAHTDVFADNTEISSVTDHLLDKANEGIKKMLQKYPDYLLQSSYRKAVTISKQEYSFLVKRTDQWVYKELDRIISEQYMNESFLSTADEDEIQKAWTHMCSEVRKTYSGEVNIDTILDNRKLGVFEHFHTQQKLFKKERALDEAEKVINQILLNENLARYDYDSFIDDVWERISPDNKEWTSRHEIKNLEGLYTTFKRKQFIKHSKETDS